jgi:exosortase
MIALLALGLILAFYGRPLAELWNLARSDEAYAYVLLVPVLAAFLLFLDRKQTLALKECSPAVGAGLVAGAASVHWWVGTQSFAPPLLAMSILALVVSWWGLFLFFFGAKAWRRSAFAMGFLLLMVPLPPFAMAGAVEGFQRASADATEALLAALGVSFFRDGFLFMLPNITVMVAEECSGIRSALILFVSVVAVSRALLHTVATRIALVSLVVPLAVAKNAIRIVGLMLLANDVDPTYITDSWLHRHGGAPLFMLAFAVVLGVALLLRRLERRRAIRTTSPLAHTT